MTGQPEVQLNIKPINSGVICPHITPFTKSFLNEVSEIEITLKDNNPLVIVIDDWIKMRDQARICRRNKRG